MVEEKVVQASSHPWVANGQGSVRFGIVGGPMGDWPILRDFVQMVEGLGFDSYWRPDHPLLTPDCWTTLAAVAASTQRLRLGSMVSCVFYRNPVLLARIVADVDRISQGRVILGLGAGDMEPEFRAMGLACPPVRERQAALAEALQVVPRLLRGETVSLFQGTHCRLEGVTLQPPAVQQPYVPLVVAGGGERTTLRLVAQYADACNIFGGPDEVAHKIDVLRRHCDAVGRNPNEIEVTAMYRDIPRGATVDDIVRGAEALAKIGVSTVVTGAVGDDPGGWLESTFGPAMEQLTAIEPAPL